MASVNLDISQKLDITCRKNDTFSLDLDIKDSDGNALSLLSYTFTMEVRESDDAVSTIIPSSDVAFTGDANGNLNVKIAAANMNVSSGSYVYDIQASIGSGATESKQTWLFGSFQVNQDVTV